MGHRLALLEDRHRAHRHIYVVLNMRIMTRMGEAVLDALGRTANSPVLHSKADLDVTAA